MRADEITIRPMAPTDLKQVHALETRSFATPWPFSSFEFEIYENAAAHLWVAEAAVLEGEKQIVGMIVAWLLVDEIHIASIAVDPDYRRQKIATGLILRAMVELVEQGAVSSTLEVVESNAAAQNLYRNFGFQPVGMRPGYYREKGESAILMTLHNLDRDHLAEISALEEDMISWRTS